MKGYFKNKGGADFGKIFAGVYPSASHSPSLFATCNSQIQIKAPYNGVGYDALYFEHAHYTGDNEGYFDFVPGAWGSLNESLTVGDFGYWKVKANETFMYYPTAETTAENFTAVEPMFQVRVYFNGGGGEIPETLPDLLKVGSAMWKKNTCYAAMGGGGKGRTQFKVYDTGGYPSENSVPNVSTGVYPTNPLAGQRQQLGAIWGTTSIGTESGYKLYPGFVPIELPLEISTGVGTGVYVRKWATLQPDAPTEGGTLKVVYRLAWFPVNIIEYYQNKLGDAYPYL